VVVVPGRDAYPHHIPGAFYARAGCKQHIYKPRGPYISTIPVRMCSIHVPFRATGTRLFCLPSTSLTLLCSNTRWLLKEPADLLIPLLADVLVAVCGAFLCPVVLRATLPRCSCWFSACSRMAVDSFIDPGRAFRGAFLVCGYAVDPDAHLWL